MSDLTKEEMNWIIEQIKISLDSNRISGIRGLNFIGEFSNDLGMEERQIMETIADKLWIQLHIT